MKCARETSSTLTLLAIVSFLAAVSVPQAHAQRIGRLFTTPEQRMVLDELRTQAQFAEPELEAEPEPQSADVPVTEQESQGPSIADLKINGIVRRRGGRTTVWVNGREIDRGDVTRDGVLVESAARRSGDVRLRLPSGTETIALRPGQKIDIETGTVLEPYEQRPGEGTQGAFARESDARPTQPPESPVPTPSPRESRDARARQSPANGPLSSRAEVLKRIDELTEAAKAAVGIGAAPASP